MESNRSFYKENESDLVWWVDNGDEYKGVMEFSFDKKKIYNLFEDYNKLPPDLKEIFDKENPFWAEFFR